MTRTHTTVDSEIGELTLVAQDGALAGLYMEQHRHRPALEAFGERAPEEPLFGRVEVQLKQYFARERREFDLPLVFHGTPFQCRVWTELSEIAYGDTITYGQLAERLGQPTASRAVGLANGKNPISLIVPCHRVVGSTGSLTGYGGGLHRKRHLLDFEMACRASDEGGQGAKRPLYTPTPPTLF
jgi:methylated-DNA-[protein]-cysteine S-methyltransferase